MQELVFQLQRRYFLARPELAQLPEAWPGQPSWFWHGEHILELLEVHRPITCVELGSWRGGSAIPTARLVRQWGGTVTCVDAWNMGAGEPLWYRELNVTLGECAKNVVAAGVSASVRFIQAGTLDAARHWKGSLIDYLYVDADHSYEGCKADLVAWWPHLRVGGLIAGDDYDDPRHGVTRAWDEFEVEYGQQFEKASTLGTDPECTRLIWGVKR